MSNGDSGDRISWPPRNGKSIAAMVVGPLLVAGIVALVTGVLANRSDSALAREVDRGHDRRLDRHELRIERLEAVIKDHLAVAERVEHTTREILREVRRSSSRRRNDD